MAITQVLYSIDKQSVLQQSTLIDERELETILCKNIELLCSDWFVIGRQIHTENGKIMDILCLERGGGLVVVELKKGLTPRDVTAQVIEYASYVDAIKTDTLRQYYQEYSEKYLGHLLSLGESYKKRFHADLDEIKIDQKPKMVIVAQQMDDGTEHIIQYLRESYKVDINILFFQVFQNGEERILSRAWFADEIEVEAPPQENGEWNHEYYVSFGEDDCRKWQDAVECGFISAGGGKWYTQTLKLLHKGDRVWVNIPHAGYVGVGIVQGERQKAIEASWILDGIEKTMKEDMLLRGNYFYAIDKPEKMEYIVPICWMNTVPVSQAVKVPNGFGNQNTVCRPTTERWISTVNFLKEKWNIT